MTLEELVLLPLCGVPAHRAIRTLADVISPSKTRPNAEDPHRRQPRVFIIQAHDGPGAMAVQMLARRGVNVCVQVPDSAARDDTNEGDDEDTDTPVTVRRSPSSSTKAKQTRYDRLEARLRAWGADEICVGEPLEVLERMIEDGRSFDGVLDTVGGAEIWERSRKILLADPELDPLLQSSPLSPSTPTTPGTISSSGNSHSSRASSNSNKRGFTMTQFTTLVGDTPSRPIPTAHDNLRSGFRSFGRSSSTGSRSRSRSPTRSLAKSSTSVLSSPSKDSLGPLLRRNTLTRVKAQKRTVSYAWVCAAADVDFEGEDVRDSLGALISMVEQGWIRPWVGDSREGSKVVPFDQAPEAFRRHGDEIVGLLKDGGTCIVKVVS
ncbi:hypothetical protein PHLCEN_2v2250 [Hermanssonia centrifuga]|uniref:Uncharacterized protein n=1 Tax=Hermanssonia centrifuga TaxID=98765 RepID=A0A2R6RPQ0_9APHY|nr:hypothetical protein PHLCEN_2v2250 [Hermanssonia centrifuga]